VRMLHKLGGCLDTGKSGGSCDVGGPVGSPGSAVLLHVIQYWGYWMGQLCVTVEYVIGCYMGSMLQQEATGQRFGGLVLCLW